MVWVRAFALRAAVYVFGSLALVLGLFFGAQLLVPDLRHPREVEDAVLFQELARQDLSQAGRVRFRVVIASSAPMAANLNAIHASLLRQAAKRLQAASGADAVEVVLAVSRQLETAPPLAALIYAPDGLGWDGQQNWQMRLTQPDPTFPKQAEDILLVAQAYLERTPEAERSVEALVGDIRSQVAGIDDATIRQVLRPRYVSHESSP